MEKKKVVVAYSGGLDTSYTVMKLAKEGYEVYAACANTGGFSPEQLKKNEENAFKLGAKEYVTLDVTQEYYEKSLKYMVFGNVMRNNCYPISVSSERIFQAIAIARYAKEIGADAIAHGSTGAGNDQIRFDMTFLVMAPGVEIITLTRDHALSRQEEVDYLNENGFFADFTKLKYSYNVGIWGTSICGGELLDPSKGLPEEAYLKHVTAETPETELKITFEKGEIVAVNGEAFADKVAAIKRLIPDAFIGVDLITGMRGETPEIFEDSRSFVDSLDITRLHVFSYSERPDTMALKIPYVVDQHTKHLRTRRMMALSDRKLAAFTKKYLGTVRPVLFEHAVDDDGLMKGFTDNYLRVAVPADTRLSNTILNVRLVEPLGHDDLIKAEIV